MELTSWTSRLEAVEQTYGRLPHLSSVIGREVLKNDQKTIETESATDGSPKLSVLFFLLERKEADTLQSIDQFFGYLKKSSYRRHRKECTLLASRLQKRTEYRHAVGALFEIEILAYLLGKNPQGSVNFYPQIQNKNFPDAKVVLGEKTVYLEATLLSQTEDQEQIWDIGHRRINPTRKEMERLGIRKVSYRSPAVTTVVGNKDLYGDALRLTRKIADKRDQLADKSPNILCIGLPDIDPDLSSVQWGISAIFSGDLRSAQSIIQRQKNRLSNDKKLSNREVQQIEQKIQRLEQWRKTFTAEPRLTGVLVFRWERSGFRPENHFLNPSPHPESQVSEAEWQTILEFGFSKTSDSRENEKIVPRKRTYKLADMLAQVTAENLHPELDTGPAQGNEEW